MNRLLLPLLLLLGSATAAGAQGRAALLLSEAPPPEGRGCDILRRVPREYEAALDSAGLRQALTADSAWRTLPGSALLSVRWNESGSVQWVRMLEGTIPTAAEGRVRGLVLAHARAVEGAREPFSLRVRVDLGAAPAVRVGRSEVCAAVPLSTGGGGGATMTPQEMAELRNARPSRIEARVDSAGQVVDVKVRQSSGSRALDDYGIRSAREGRFRPELVDGMPVASWVELRSRTSTTIRRP